MSQTGAAGPAEPAFWAERWQAGQTGWDQGMPHPCLDALLAEAVKHGLLPDRPQSCRVLEPGCGRAHTGAALARRGFEVTAFDVVDTAIAAARALYGNVPGLTLTIADALVTQPAWRHRFDAIYDRAMLCALPPPRRRAYALTSFEHLREGGALLSVVVAARRERPEAGPPFAVSAADLDDMLSPGFELIFSHQRDLNQDPREMGGVAASELCTLWRRRPVWTAPEARLDREERR